MSAIDTAAKLRRLVRDEVLVELAADRERLTLDERETIEALQNAALEAAMLLEAGATKEAERRYHEANALRNASETDKGTTR